MRHRLHCINPNRLPQYCNQATLTQVVIVAGAAKRRQGQHFTEPLPRKPGGILVHLTNYRGVAG
jgi:hypothetical protein